MSEKILVVDDDTDGLKLIGLMLQRHGYQVIAANAGNQAIAKAHSEQPDLIILDVMMPDINGYEVCRRLRANPDTQSIPIIMFTAKTLIDDKVAGFEAGADDYLTKPTHPAELAARVKSILERSSKHQQKNNRQGMTIGIVGVKGGLGASTVTANLGAALRLMDESPIVADFRLGNGSLALLLGIPRPTGMYNILKHPIDGISRPIIERELIAHTTGIRALLSSYRPREALYPASSDAAIKIIRGLRTLGSHAIFDLGNGLNVLNERLFTEMDKIVCLIEPTHLAIGIAREFLQEFSSDVKKRLDIVVTNRQHNSLQPAWHEVEAQVGHEIRAIISAAPELAHQANAAGIPMVIHEPSSVVAGQFHKLAEHINTGTQLSVNAHD